MPADFADRSPSSDLSPPARFPEPSLTIGEFLQLISRHRLQFGAIVLFFVAAALIAAFVLPPVYRAEVLVSVVDSSSHNGAGGSLSSMLSSYGAAASLVGINLGGSSDRKEALGELHSHILGINFVAQRNLLPVLFAKKWDAASQRWNVEDPKKIPDLDDGEAKLDKIREIGEDKLSGLVFVDVYWTDPQLAADWANGMIADANAYLRDKAVTQSQRNVDYLNEQLARTNIVEVRQGIFRLLESEIKNIMVAQGTDEYTFKVIDPARPPKLKYSPKRKLLVIGGLLAGLIVASCFLVLRHLYGAPPADRRPPVG
jgi:uncharacterized protein involved in exopolysaccharide biosynthesis